MQVPMSISITSSLRGERQLFDQRRTSFRSRRVVSELAGGGVGIRLQNGYKLVEPLWSPANAVRRRFVELIHHGCRTLKAGHRFAGCEAGPLWSFGGWGEL